VIVDYLAEEIMGLLSARVLILCGSQQDFDDFLADGTMAALAEKYGLELAE